VFARHYASSLIVFHEQILYLFMRGCHGCDRMIVGFTTTCAISPYHHISCEFKPRSWRMYLIQLYAINFVNDLQQVDCFIQVFWFPSTIKLTATI